MCSLRYVSSQTNKQTCWSQYFAPLPGAKYYANTGQRQLWKQRCFRHRIRGHNGLNVITSICFNYRVTFAPKITKIGNSSSSYSWNCQDPFLKQYIIHWSYVLCITSFSILTILSNCIIVNGLVSSCCKLLLSTIIIIIVYMYKTGIKIRHILDSASGILRLVVKAKYCKGRFSVDVFIQGRQNRVKIFLMGNPVVGLLLSAAYTYSWRYRKNKYGTYTLLLLLGYYQKTQQELISRRDSERERFCTISHTYFKIPKKSPYFV